jgi:hypothetical protein
MSGNRFMLTGHRIAEERKPMKFWFVLMTIVALGVVAFTGCEDDDDEAAVIVVTNESGQVIEVPVSDADEGDPGGDDGEDGLDGDNGEDGMDGDSGEDGDDDIPPPDRPELEAPSLIAPANGASIPAPSGLTTVTLSWNSAEGAEAYRVRVEASGSSWQYDVGGTSYDLPAGPAVYTWQVASVRGDLTEWTGTRQFTVEGSWTPDD